MRPPNLGVKLSSMEIRQTSPGMGPGHPPRRGVATPLDAVSHAQEILHQEGGREGGREGGGEGREGGEYVEEFNDSHGKAQARTCIYTTQPHLQNTSHCNVLGIVEAEGVRGWKCGSGIVGE